MLIWGRPGYQTMMTGASDPVSFFVKIKTETYGIAKIVKTSEDGIVSGIPFNISGMDILGNKVDETVTTGENGQIKEKAAARHLSGERAAGGPLCDPFRAVCHH